jgi:hypothetical protein
VSAYAHIGLWVLSNEAKCLWNDIDRDEPIPVPLYQSQAPDGLSWERTCPFAMRSRRLAARVMVRPSAFVMFSSHFRRFLLVENVMFNSEYSVFDPHAHSDDRRLFKYSLQISYCGHIDCLRSVSLIIYWGEVQYVSPLIKTVILRDTYLARWSCTTSWGRYEWRLCNLFPASDAAAYGTGILSAASLKYESENFVATRELGLPHCGTDVVWHGAVLRSSCGLSWFMMVSV